MTQETKPKAYILLGPPGSGKSTQAEIFKRELGTVHVDMGSALRAAAAEPTPFGEKLSRIMNEEGGLVSDDIVRAVLDAELRKIAPDQPVIVDGAPRRKSQIDEVLAAFERYGKSFHKAVFIELSREDSVARISRRFSCTACGAKLILGKNFEPGGKCPYCGGEVTQRDDDTPEGVRARWQVFHDATLPVLEYFESRGSLVRVSGSSDPETIFLDIRKELFV